MTVNVIKPVANDFSDVSNAIQPFNVLADAYGEHLAAVQLRLEHEAYTEGEKRFIKQLNRQIEAGELADNAAAKPLIQTLVPRLSEHLKQWIHSCEYKEDGSKKTGRKHVAYHILSGADATTIAAITVKQVLATCAKTDAASIQAVASSIARNVEDELRYGRIRDEEAKFFKNYVEEGLNKRNGLLYKKAYMQVVEKDMLARGDIKSVWTNWTAEETTHVGIKLMELLIESTGLISLDRPYAGQADKDTNFVCLAPEYVEALSKRAGSLAAVSPMFQPCVVPPRPWTSTIGGGYWAAGRKPLALIRTGTKKGLMRYAEVEMPEVYEAVNLAQNTAWKINTKVLSVVNQIVNWKNCPVSDVPALEREELPAKPDDIDTNEAALKHWKKQASAIYRKDKARVSRRLSMEFTVAQANKFAQFKAIWFPMNLDWRGRVYAVPMFNPQGNDMTKGLLTFAKGKPLGSDGMYWLKIHGANCAGVDKVPFPERIEFIEDNHANIMAAAENPLENLWWAEQDSPFCFLAFCFEYAGAIKHGKSYVSSLPLAFDGSCSGIQHFSAMLLDEIGGAAVNLLPSAIVQDIYRIVADKVNDRLKVDAINGSQNTVEVITDAKTGEATEKTTLGTTTLANQWLAFGVNRGVTKRSVMTLAYGSKEYGFRDQVLEDTIRPAIDNGKGMMFTQPTQAAGYMAKLIWECVSVTVVAAVDAMKWLQTAAKLLAAEVKDKKTKEVLRARCAVHWVTPDGFPVWQEYRKPIQKRLDLIFLGSFRLQPTINTYQDSGIDAHKQETGIAPNFVHSMDGSHLRTTVVKANRKYGITEFALIHDSFGTLAADAGNLFKAVRETLVETYEHNDVIADFYEQFADQLHESQLEKMPAMPPKGNLDLQEILKSDFAFA
ncbi:DNA-directed RNA polymerase [Pectobacterium phage MA1A]|nr:DNA-directed RNA polymerase [Pectobacterium phage MA6]QGH45320.1 DNA-directed RNA polymerase [Pectobacterium phage MA1A]